MSFTKATKKNAKLRLALSGTAGAGKTFSALEIATAFGGRIAVMDSERGSASLYADRFDFDVCELEEKNPQEYLEKIREAAAEGYDVLVIDSFSHSWVGALETIDKMGGWVKGGKHVSPLVAKIIDSILSYPGHVIATMRSKSEHVIEKDERTGKTTIRKVGLAPVARDGTEYEFSVLLDLSTDGTFRVSKSRCSALPVESVHMRDTDTVKVAETLKEWLNSGEKRTPLDLVLEKIRFCTSKEQLAALVPEIAKLSDEDRAACRAPYMRRKAEIEGIAPKVSQ